MPPSLGVPLSAKTNTFDCKFRDYLGASTLEPTATRSNVGASTVETIQVAEENRKKTRIIDT